MVACGRHHTVLLRSDGTVVAFGDNLCGQCSVPRAPEGVMYCAVAAGELHTVLLRNDGQAVGFGYNEYKQNNIPLLEAGVSYIQIAAGKTHNVLLRSDGQAVGYGREAVVGQFDDSCVMLPRAPEGYHYTQVVAGRDWTALLRSDGQVLCAGLGSTTAGLFSPDVRYVHLAGQGDYLFALTLDGEIAGVNFRCIGGHRRFTLQRQGDGLHVAQIAGEEGPMILTDIGTVAWLQGSMRMSPPTAAEHTVVQIACSERHQVFLRADGEVIAQGADEYGQCRVPELETGVVYSASQPPSVLPVLLEGERLDESWQVSCRLLTTGTLLSSWKVPASLQTAAVLPAISMRIGQSGMLLRVIREGTHDEVKVRDRWLDLFQV